MSLKNLLTNLFRKPEPKPAPKVKEDVKEFLAEHPKPRHNNTATPTSHKLEQDHKEHVCKLIGYGFTDNEVVNQLKESFGIEMSAACIFQNYRSGKKWQALIKQHREAYLSTYDDVPGFHKKTRLDRMERAYTKAEKKGDIKSIISLTEHQRKEVEGTGDTNLTLISNRFYNMTDAELDSKQAELLKSLEEEDKKNGIRRIEGETGGQGQDNGAKDV